jgi:hypothetical protein
MRNPRDLSFHEILDVLARTEDNHTLLSTFLKCQAKSIDKATNLLVSAMDLSSSRTVLRRDIASLLHEAADRVNVTRLADERQARDTELKLHREIALKLIDLGYRAMATRLHPDRGGSQ